MGGDIAAFCVHLQILVFQYKFWYLRTETALFDFAELTNNDEINELINQYEQEAEGFPDAQE